MATWKRLTRMTAGDKMDVNMDIVLHIQRFKDHTMLLFAATDGSKAYRLAVKETPDEIHAIKPLRPK